MQKSRIQCTRLDFTPGEIATLDAIYRYAGEIDIMWSELADLYLWKAETVYTDRELKTLITILEQIYRAPVMYGKPKPEGFLQFLNDLKRLTRQNQMNTNLTKFCQEVSPALVCIRA